MDQQSGGGFVDSDDESVTEKKSPIKTVLVVDDEEELLLLFKKALEKYGYVVETARNGNEAIECYYRNPSDLIITDIMMPEKDGHSMMVEIFRDYPDAKVFAFTGYRSFDSDLELDMAKGIGACRTFSKPVKFDTILSAIKELDS